MPAADRRARTLSGARASGSHSRWESCGAPRDGAREPTAGIDAWRTSWDLTGFERFYLVRKLWAPYADLGRRSTKAQCVGHSRRKAPAAQVAVRRLSMEGGDGSRNGGCDEQARPDRRGRQVKANTATPTVTVTSSSSTASTAATLAATSSRRPNG